MMKPLPLLLLVVLAFSDVLGDEVSFYGLKLSTGRAGVDRVTVSNFPWLTTKGIRTRDDIDGILKREERRPDGSYRPVRPAIFYISKEKAASDATSLGQVDQLYFSQKDVKERLEEYRWYWAQTHTTAGRLLAEKYELKHDTALLIFEPDGSVLHIEEPITGMKSVAHAMRMITDMRQMEAAVKADLPYLRKEYSAENYKTLVKYLVHTDKHRIYATTWTKEKLAEIRRAVNGKGDELIQLAESMAANGKEREALKLLSTMKREFRPLEVAGRADEAAARIRGQGS